MKGQAIIGTRSGGGGDDVVVTRVGRGRWGRGGSDSLLRQGWVAIQVLVDGNVAQTGPPFLGVDTGLELANAIVVLSSRQAFEIVCNSYKL